MAMSGTYQSFRPQPHRKSEDLMRNREPILGTIVLFCLFVAFILGIPILRETNRRAKRAEQRQQCEATGGTFAFVETSIYVRDGVTYRATENRWMCLSAPPVPTRSIP